MQTYNLYIGANNRTGEVDKDKLLNVLDRHYDEGYTMVEAVGRWMGKNEKSVIVTIKSDREELKQVVQCLNDYLEQECIGVQEVNEILFV